MTLRTIVILVFLGTVACARSNKPDVRMVSSAAVPAAAGTIDVARTDDGNTSLLIEVRHLAPPNKLHPDATTYVVWARTRGMNQPQNLGALRVDADLHGRLSTVTPLRNFDVFITAESSPTVMAPTNDRVLSASIAQ